MMEKSFYSYAAPFVILNGGEYRMRSGLDAMQGRLFSGELPVNLPAELDHDEKVYAIALSLVSSPAGSGVWGHIAARMPGEIYRMIESRSDPETMVHCLAVYPGTPLEAARQIIDRVEQSPARILTYWDREYPSLLREIPRPPLVLYAVGDTVVRRSVAIVGTRKSDPKSALIARRIGHDLASRGFTVVSGMALGIDREAHLGALDAGGSTIGVLPGGIDIVYPRSNHDLYAKVNGSPVSALISEYPPGIYIAGNWTFARRNRIISGLSAGTVVVKAGERSGALITARHALEQNREVFACAGHSFDEEYAGCHWLIRSGAALVSSSQDILDELDRSGSARMPFLRSASMAAEDGLVPGTLAGKILRLLSEREYDVDGIIRATGGAPGDINESIVALELEGKILRNGNTISRM
ncbi:MAG TPA: DNA-processing protein DprA [Spirochaetota bacterium]|nr:DNA-processing protein DprA [Spirochaetota bacterium]HOD15345.1 DNA-processing protein DprA [Spirochaetota bacterium]HPG50280.1 DNA-processing protein DprA [Spirochaetota bacterium]HPN12461.1 DNA-processing protein DprA [Spirochaetota bacterium]